MLSYESCPACTPQTRNQCQVCHGSGRVKAMTWQRSRRRPPGSDGCATLVVCAALVAAAALTGARR